MELIVQRCNVWMGMGRGVRWGFIGTQGGMAVDHNLNGGVRSASLVYRTVTSGRVRCQW
jgi:hypothetical protein